MVTSKTTGYRHPGNRTAQPTAELLNSFAPEDVIVVDRQEGASLFRRMESTDLADWLEDYTLGELWLRNILGGRLTFAGAVR